MSKADSKTTVGKLGTMANYVLRGARAHYVTERPMPGQTAGVNAYTFRVAWSAEDREWVATCDQLPSLSYLHPGAGDAVEGIFATVVDYVKDQIS